MGAVTDWPQNAVHQMQRALYQAERTYGGGLTDPVTFGDRPLWRVMLDWGVNEIDTLRYVRAQIASVMLLESAWNLFEKGQTGDAASFINETWGAQIQSFSTYENGEKAQRKLVFKSGKENILPNFATSSRKLIGEYIQVGRYVMEITDVDQANRTVTVANFPELIDSMTTSVRNAQIFGWNRDHKTWPLTIRAKILDAQAPSLRTHKGGLTGTLDPITIVEVP